VTNDLGLDYELRGTTAAVVVKGDLDMAAAFRLEPAIERVVSQDRVDEVVLDLAGVDFMDSAGLGSLLSAQQRMHDLGIRATVTRPSKAVERVLESSGTRDVLMS